MSSQQQPALSLHGHVGLQRFVHLDVSSLQQPALSLDMSVYSSLCTWMCLVYSSLRCPWTCRSKAVCAVPGHVGLWLSVLPLGMSNRQKPALSLNMSVYSSLCTWACLVYSRLRCP